MKPLSKEIANKIFDVLVDICGAYEGDMLSERNNFIYHFCKENPPKEWRFGGKLGFGGKLRYNYNINKSFFYVDCYPEDETKERLAIIKIANKKLKEIFENL